MALIKLYGFAGSQQASFHLGQVLVADSNRVIRRKLEKEWLGVSTLLLSKGVILSKTEDDEKLIFLIKGILIILEINKQNMRNKLKFCQVWIIFNGMVFRHYTLLDYQREVLINIYRLEAIFIIGLKSLRNKDRIKNISNRSLSRQLKNTFCLLSVHIYYVDLKNSYNHNKIHL
ncbi:hypothetical protein BpHYR1_033620 [Brachionus plicatilis]|uniref:Uncharacterized protein n=1 Tax=Brachionus plicatilis TaxID=10195 RepID=A0A3M7SZ62_BRAPC|nr:hypothetical protein BpHYR1_033620 [Brachionus plicatilis]